MNCRPTATRSASPEATSRRAVDTSVTSGNPVDTSRVPDQPDRTASTTSASVPGGSTGCRYSSPSGSSPASSAVYVARLSVSAMPLAVPCGEIRMPVRSAPMASATAAAVSTTNRTRFCADPP